MLTYPQANLGPVSRSERDPAARRGWGEDDSASPILHVDMDAFFAEVELLDHPHLRGRPVIIGGDQRSVVLSATYEARAFGVHSAMPVAHARALCPPAVVLPPHHQSYVDISREVMAVLHDITPLVEQVSIDEAFLDVDGARRRLGTPVHIARLIREEVRARVGVPASVGVAATKFVAKLASGHAKPDGLLLVPATATVDFLHSLPVGALWGVGAKTRERLVGHGIDTVATLAGWPLGRLQRIVGQAAGHKLHELASGRDPRVVEPERIEKSIGTEDTFAQDVTDREVLRSVLLEQSHRVAARLRAAGFVAGSVSIKVRHADFTTLSRSRTMPATDVAHELFATAVDLLDRLQLPRAGLRLLGVRGESLARAHDGVQLRLDEEGQRRDVETAMDGVRARFGTGVLGPATLLHGGTRRRSRDS